MTPLKRPKKVSRIPQFGLWTIMLITFVCAVTASAGSYFWKAVMNESASKTDISPRGTFIIFALVAPMATLILVSAFYQITQLKQRRKKQKRRYRQDMS